MDETQPILVCRCAERGLIELDDAARAALEAGAIEVADLCRASAERDSVLSDVAAAARPIIYACHSRAVTALFDFANAPLPADAVVNNLRVEGGAPTVTPTGESSPAWFPVIDRARCTSCGQCLEFCLFGVYERGEDHRVEVKQPGACKNNCPACARICPETAIIFPKVGESPLNGAVISDESERSAVVKVQVDQLLGGDVYAALNARKKKRRSLLNRKKVERALAERKKCAETSAAKGKHDEQI